MSLYFVKPVVWNTKRYMRPAGGAFTSGYPAENGFGHEEWNNSVDLNFVDQGENKHAFHTESLGTQPLDKFAGQIFVFMIASNGGKQFLVSVAGKSTALFGDEHRKERLRLLAKIKGRSRFAAEAWSVEKVKKAYDGDHAEFRRRWKNEQDWFVSWTCPVGFYLGLSKPLELNPRSITGRNRLIQMYGSYQQIERATALRILDQIHSREDARIVANLKDECGSNDADVHTDIEQVDSRKSLRPTTRRALIDARLGQGKFRAQLDAIWGGSCGVTGCSVSEVLRASHIQPWRSSNDKERLDAANGVLLVAHLDALFDAGLITFTDQGSILSSPQLLDDGRPKLGVTGKLRVLPSAETKKYLRYHRANIFRVLPHTDP
jgi:hypothetical protein